MFLMHFVGTRAHCELRKPKTVAAVPAWPLVYRYRFKFLAPEDHCDLLTKRATVLRGWDIEAHVRVHELCATACSVRG